MSMLRVCEHPGCTTRTLGGRCVDHERQHRVRVRAASAARQAGTAGASRPAA